MTEELKSICVRFGDIEVKYTKKTPEQIQDYPAIADMEYEVSIRNCGTDYFTCDGLIKWLRDVNAAVKAVLDKTTAPAADRHSAMIGVQKAVDIIESEEKKDV